MDEFDLLAASDDDQPSAGADDVAADLPQGVASAAPGAGTSMPSPLSVVDLDESIDSQRVKLLEASALFNAAALATLEQKLLLLASASEDPEVVRKTVQTMRDGALAPDKRKDTATSQAPLIIMFERAPAREGVVVDVRSGAALARQRAAAKAEDAKLL